VSCHFLLEGEESLVAAEVAVMYGEEVTGYIMILRLDLETTKRLS